MADKAFTESGIGDFNKDLEANIKRLERLSKAADSASGSVAGLSDTYNTLAQLAEGKLQFKVSGLKSLKFLIDIDDAKFAKLNKNLEQLDSISKKFDIQFNVSGLRDINRLQNINIDKIKESLKSLEEAAKDFQNIDVTNAINVSDDLVKGLSRLERLSRFDVNNLSNTLKNIKEASKDFEDINIDAVINVSDGLVKGLSRLERLSRFDVSKLNNTIKELQDVASEPINIDMNININEGELAKLKELNELLKNYKLINKVNNTSGGGSSTSNKGGKSKKDLFFTITRLSDTATSAIKPVSSLANNITKLGMATGGTIAALTLLAKITVEAQKNTSNYARSMTVMNKELSLLDKRSLETTNKINTLNNRMSNLMQGLGNLLSPVLDFIVDLAEVATSFLPSGEREDIIGTTKAGISSTSHQSGMTRGTTDILADNTYSIASGLTSKYGEQASVIAEKLASAWKTGSEAAKDYGVVLNDNVLTGYLWNKGIDIANVEITDAMKQYYRYQLMVDQTSGKVTDSMIKDWTSLGFMIDKTKGKLFSFDEVIQLVAADPTIPDLVGDNTDINNSESSRSTPPGIFNHDTMDIINTYGDGYGLNIPVNVPVTVPGGDLLEGASVLLKDIDPEYPVNIAINIPLLRKLETTKQLVDYVDDKFDTEVDIKVVGLDILNNVKSLLYEIRALILSLSGMKINIPGNNKNTNVNTNVNTNSKAIKHDTVTKIEKNIPNKNNIESQYDKDTLDTARKIATKNNSDFDKVNNTDKQYYAIIAKEVNKNPVLTIKDGVDMFNSYKSTGKVETWWNSKAADNLGTGMAVAAGILGTAGSLLTGIGLSGAAGIAGAATPSVASTVALPSAASTVALPSAASTAALPSAASTLALPAASSSSTVVTIADWVSALAGVGFADGGIGTHEIHNATLFEDDKKEAVIPLETSEGIDYLATAMSKAGASNSNSSGDIVINLTLSGLNLANNDAEWERVGRKIGEVIDIQRQRRGELNYGSSF